MTNAPHLNITVTGLGYVGLSLATMLSVHTPVYALDIDDKRVKSINQRLSPIDDKEIISFFNTKKLKLVATCDEQLAYQSADIVIIATPTNYDVEKASFDTTSVEKTIVSVLSYQPSATIIVKSTVPVGFTHRMQEQYPDAHIVFSPEFLRETKALHDNLYPSRIIFGIDSNDTDSHTKIEQFTQLLLASIHKKDVAVITMPPSEAEAVKLFSNTYLAMRVSYFNELDTYAEVNGLDTQSIIHGVELDPRIGDYYNNPSFGYGGYCLPKDTKQLLANYDSIPQNLVKAIVDSNETRKQFIANQVIDLVHNIPNPTIGIYRLTMKSHSDNFRESSIQGIIQKLQAVNIPIVIFEPFVTQSHWQNIPVIADFKQFCQQSTIILANRFTPELNPVHEKVYTKDLFYRD